MRTTQILLDQSRRATENEEFSDFQGINDEEFLQYVNDAQSRIQSLIYQAHPDLFVEETIISAVAAQESYDIPSDAIGGNSVVSVEFSVTGQAIDYYNLRQGRLAERYSGLQSDPAFYIRRSGDILLMPSPQSSAAKIRLNYVQSVPYLDIQRAKVSAVTLGASTITALTFDTTILIDDTALNKDIRFTIVDKDGVIKMKSVLFTNINTTTGVVTIDPSFTFASGESIAVGDFAVRGARSTTHSKLPDLCEKYLIAYTNWKILKRDSSADAMEQTDEIMKMEEEIIGLFNEPDQDVDYPVILDDTYMDTETW